MKFIALGTFVLCIFGAGFATTTAGLHVLLLIAAMNVLALWLMLLTDNDQ